MAAAVSMPACAGARRHCFKDVYKNRSKPSVTPRKKIRYCTIPNEVHNSRKQTMTSSGQFRIGAGRNSGKKATGGQTHTLTAYARELTWKKSPKQRTRTVVRNLSLESRPPPPSPGLTLTRRPAGAWTPQTSRVQDAFLRETGGVESFPSGCLPRFVVVGGRIVSRCTRADHSLRAVVTKNKECRSKQRGKACRDINSVDFEDERAGCTGARNVRSQHCCASLVTVGDTVNAAVLRIHSRCTPRDLDTRKGHQRPPQEQSSLSTRGAKHPAPDTNPQAMRATAMVLRLLRAAPSHRTGGQAGGTISKHRSRKREPKRSKVCTPTLSL